MLQGMEEQDQAEMRRHITAASFPFMEQGAREELMRELGNKDGKDGKDSKDGDFKAKVEGLNALIMGG